MNTTNINLDSDPSAMSLDELLPQGSYQDPNSIVSQGYYTNLLSLSINDDEANQTESNAMLQDPNDVDSQGYLSLSINDNETNRTASNATLQNPNDIVSLLSLSINGNKANQTESLPTNATLEYCQDVSRFVVKCDGKQFISLIRAKEATDSNGYMRFRGEFTRALKREGNALYKNQLAISKLTSLAWNTAPVCIKDTLANGKTTQSIKCKCQRKHKTLLRLIEQ
ncbi:11483_t:CDS:2 [Paraglomus brasilianum]|uniref:11483_t:CDS:1 n=1 Tax=Paraglomus brasilianum TaxID=144538 RepID=A0A9N9D2M7_9GLOM|nr:11483_t:CDS:2 [Paraglomus brasilianum]